MTRADAIKQVLENLRVIDSISNPAAEDEQAVGKRLDQERARLTEKGLCWWGAEAIPDSVSGAFCDLVAARCQNLFGKSYDATGAEAMIATVKSSAVVEEQRAVYF